MRSSVRKMRPSIKSFIKKKIAFLKMFSFFLFFFSFFVNPSHSSRASVKGVKKILGAGASFPYPLYSKWIREYHDFNKKVQINYQSIGSGGGIRQLLNQTVDFGASDAPMKDSEIKRASLPVLHIPTVLGAVALTYNLPQFKEELKLSPQVLSEIFLGKIKTWDDPRLTKRHPLLKESKYKDILVVYRSDGSGTTAVFTDYLSKVSAGWKKTVGKGKSVQWPSGIGAKGNEGVAGLIKQTVGSIGYVELNYAEIIKLPVASIQNSNGFFIKPSMQSVTEAAKGSLKKMPEDFRVSITNAKGDQSYPIASYTYLLVYQKMKARKGKELVAFLRWMLDKGQESASSLSYAPLPKELVKKVEKKLKEIQLEI